MSTLTVDCVQRRHGISNADGTDRQTDRLKKDTDRHTHKLIVWRELVLDIERQIRKTHTHTPR